MTEICLKKLTKILTTTTKTATTKSQSAPYASFEQLFGQTKQYNNNDYSHCSARRSNRSMGVKEAATFINESYDDNLKTLEEV